MSSNGVDNAGEADAIYERGTLARIAKVKHIAVTMDGNRRFGERGHRNVRKT